MRESFIDTMSVASKPYVLYFELHPSEPIYFVSIYNKRDIPPFQMEMVDEKQWKIVGPAIEIIKKAEEQISALIVDNYKEQRSKHGNAK